MKKRWKPAQTETVKKRTVMIPDETWEIARTHPLGAAGLIRQLLENERADQEGRYREQRRELALGTPVGFMAVASRPDGFILHLEDTPVVYYLFEPGQPWPVLSIPGHPGQVMSIRLSPDQTITVPLKLNQTVSLPTPIHEKQLERAKAYYQRQINNSPRSSSAAGVNATDLSGADETT